VRRTRPFVPAQPAGLRGAQEGGREHEEARRVGRLNGACCDLVRLTSTNRKDPAVVEVGKPAPDFTLTSDSGETITLSDLQGKPVVLYFYPKDDTPGCTKQACGIRDAWSEFERTGAVVLGVSPDDRRSHVAFREKYQLPFALLADTDHSTAEDYGVWKEKSYAGKTYMGVERSTFVIDADGNVAKELRNVKPDTHAADVLAALAS
jgi:peroxiredoxin Q/BCP